MEPATSRYGTIFRALADTNRLRVLNVLFHSESLCGCEFMAALQMPQYEVSRHLAAMRRAGLVTARKRGKWVYYSLIDEPGGLRDLWRMLRGRFGEDRNMVRDAERIKRRLALRKGGSCVVGITSYGRLARRPAKVAAGTRT